MKLTNFIKMLLHHNKVSTTEVADAKQRFQMERDILFGNVDGIDLY